MIDESKVDALCNNSAYQVSVVIPKLLKAGKKGKDVNLLHANWLALRNAETRVLVRMLHQATEGDRGCLRVSELDEDVVKMALNAKIWRESCLNQGILSFDRGDITILSLAISRICKKLRLSKWLLWIAVAIITIETAILVKFW